jgi:hypothetical protein
VAILVGCFVAMERARRARDSASGDFLASTSLECLLFVLVERRGEWQEECEFGWVKQRKTPPNGRFWGVLPGFQALVNVETLNYESRRKTLFSDCGDT